MENEPQNSIITTVNFNGDNRKVEIKQGESSDGAPFYYCDVDGKRITQIRKDDHNNWKQLWGELDEITLKSIGEAIEKSEI